MPRKPPWRVQLVGLDEWLFSSQAKAYKFAIPYIAQPQYFTVTIYHWENGKWRVYEHYEKES